MKKAPYPLAVALVCAASLLMFAPLPPTRAQNSVYDLYVGSGGSVAYTVTGGPPGTTVIYNITASNPGVIVYSTVDAPVSGPWSDSLSVPVTLDASGNGRLAYYIYAKAKGVTDQTTCSPQVRCFTPLHYTVTPPATGIAKLQYLKDGAYVDVPATLNVFKGDTLTFKAFPSPADSRFYTFDPMWSGASGATGKGVDSTTVTFNTLSKTTKDFKTVVAGVENGGSASLNVIVADGVKSMSFEAIDPASVIDGNPNTGNGQRIFPDKNSAADAVNRRKVRVKAATSFGAGQTIYFKSFDLDDPASDAAPVDPNGGLGGDNRGGGAGTAQQSGILSPAGGTGTTSSATATTDAAGFASVELTVTMQPGDNFMVAASHDSKYLPGVTVSGVTLKDSTGLTVGEATTKAKATPMLTVWRRVHVETDSMGLVTGNNVVGTVTAVAANAATNTADITVDQPLEVNRFENGRLTAAGASYTVLSNTNGVVTVAGTATPPVGSPFTMYDDDDFDNGDVGSLDGDDGENVTEPDRGLLATAFAPAYVLPVFDIGDNNDLVPFVLNTDTSSPASVISTYDFDAAATEADANFWTAYLLGAYQGGTSQDHDPALGEGRLYGVADSINGLGASVFNEVIRFPEGRFTPEVNNAATTAHEIGHLFNGDHTDGGLMEQSSTRTTIVFSDITLNKIRSISHP